MSYGSFPYMLDYFRAFLWPWRKVLFIINPFGLRSSLVVIWWVYHATVAVLGMQAGFRFKTRDFKRMSPRCQLQFTAFRRLDEHSFSLRWHFLGAWTVLPLRAAVAAFSVAIHIALVFVLGSLTPRRNAAHSAAEVKLHHLGISAIHAVTAIITRILLLCYGVAAIRENFQNRQRRLKQDNLSRERLTTVVSNHVSHCDVLYFAMRICPSFIAKTSLKKSIFSYFTDVLECVYINRTAEEDRLEGLRKISERQREIESQVKKPSALPAPPLVIFPEGTTSSGKELLRLKRGAFVAMDSCTPVVFIYRCPGFNLSVDTLRLWDHILLSFSNLSAVTLDVFWLADIHRKDFVRCPISGDDRHPDEVTPLVIDKVRERMLLAILRNQHWPLDGDVRNRVAASNRSKLDCRAELEGIAAQRRDEYIREADHGAE